mmetsp:Transcript_20628/g.43114  ORF Transcript_20628/g.43114 Transcript_20628/m.43114 type:complete len:326 (+) Transcript_20628:1371-2348(+)
MPPQKTSNTLWKLVGGVIGEIDSIYCTGDARIVASDHLVDEGMATGSLHHVGKMHVLPPVQAPNGTGRPVVGEEARFQHQDHGLPDVQPEGREGLAESLRHDDKIHVEILFARPPRRHHFGEQRKVGGHRSGLQQVQGPPVVSPFDVYGTKRRRRRDRRTRVYVFHPRHQGRKLEDLVFRQRGLVRWVFDGLCNGPAGCVCLLCVLLEPDGFLLGTYRSIENHEFFFFVVSVVCFFATAFDGIHVRRNDSRYDGFAQPEIRSDQDLVVAIVAGVDGKGNPTRLAVDLFLDDDGDLGRQQIHNKNNIHAIAVSVFPVTLLLLFLLL